MIVENITDREIIEAKELYQKEFNAARSKGLKYIFYHENGWIGILGENSVERNMKQLTRVTKAYKVEGCDFRFYENTFDVKTTGGRGGYYDGYNFIINAQQLLHPTDGYIFCYYNMVGKVMNIVGWIWHKDMLTKSRLMLKGQTFSNGRSKVLEDCRIISAKSLLHPMQL